MRWVRPTLAHVSIGGVDVAATQYSFPIFGSGHDVRVSASFLPMAVEYALLPQSANTIIQLPMPERRFRREMNPRRSAAKLLTKDVATSGPSAATRLPRYREA